jgi:xanthine dehydrogenase accessory factor
MRVLQKETAVVRIVVAEVRGSAPREPGAFMLVTREGVEGTIGGGRLEWESIAAARELLAGGAVAARLDEVVLGADLGQCCGGVVKVWLERLTTDDVGFLRVVADARGLSSTVADGVVERRVLRLAAAAAAHKERERNETGGEGAPGVREEHEGDQRAWIERGPDGRESFVERLDDPFPQVWLFGAGHVGQALARILVDLPVRLTWVDSRAELFPALEGVRIRKDVSPMAALADAPEGAYFLVMTHSHPLDYELCKTILQRGDFAWLGLIGSDSKAARFRSRLRREGLVIERLTCPIGIEGIESKWPAAIAVSVAAQIMQLLAVKEEEKTMAAVECREKNCESCAEERAGGPEHAVVSPS